MTAEANLSLHTWEQIKQMYPDQWVLVKDMKYVTGNLTHAVVVFANKENQAVLDFDVANESRFSCRMGIMYTGQPIDDVEYNDEVELSEAVVY